MSEILQTQKDERPFLADSLASNVGALIVGLGLLSILFYIPGPVIPVSHPYKAELVLSVCLVSILLSIRVSGLSLVKLFAGIGVSSRRIALGFLAFAGFGLLSILWARSIESVFHHTVIWGLYVSYFTVVASIVKWQDSVRFPVVALSTAAGVTGVLCLIDYLTYEEFRLVESFIRVRYGKYAELTSTIAPFLIASAVLFKGRVRWFSALGATLAWLTSMLALSKGAFIAGVAGITILFVGAVVASERGRRMTFAAVGVVWLVFTIGFQVLFSVTSDIPATADYISGAVDPTQTSANFRTYIWKTGIQMGRDHWLIGIGADGFGRQFNNGTASFRANSPHDVAMEYGEDRLVERAHNEPIQIFAELGIIGIIVFAIPFVIAGVLVRRSFGAGNDILLWALIGSTVAFAFSSLVSSFSFRSAQNGIAFLVVFAGIVGLVDKRSKAELSKRAARLILVFVLAAIMAVFTYTGLKIATESYVSRAENTVDHEAALADYDIALRLDPEYAGAWLSLAARYAAMNDYENAAFATQKGIDNGIGMSLTYSQLATQYKMLGSSDKAADAYREGVRVYPRSIYMRIEAAEYFASVGLDDEARSNTDAAFAINAKDAEGWIRLIRYGGNRAFHMAKEDGMSTTPSELLPQNTVQMYSEKVPMQEQ